MRGMKMFGGLPIESLYDYPMPYRPFYASDEAFQKDIKTYEEFQDKRNRAMDRHAAVILIVGAIILCGIVLSTIMFLQIVPLAIDILSKR